MKKKFVMMILTLFISFPLFSISPTLLLGLGIKTLYYPDEEGITSNDYVGNVKGLFSHRDKFTEIGYYAFFTNISGDFTYLDPYIYSDEETFSLELGFQFENSSLICMSDFHSSITGTETDIPYYTPEWELRYYFITERKKVQPYISYQGYYMSKPGSDEDAFYEGAEIGIKQRPAITQGYQLSINIGFEQWPQYPVYTLDGSLSDEVRNDFLTGINGKIEGIFNFFLDWEIMLSALYCRSNANTYDAVSGYFQEKSEDRAAITSEINLKWNPSRYIQIVLNPFCTPEFYFYKRAVTESGLLTDEKMWSVSSGGTVHIDWTPDNKFYAFLETEGFVYFSNVNDDFNWNLLFHLGLEYSVRF
ncbi:MAG: hypothetical protein JXJ04_04005 [Spirochaetales bacterium]|nr:hypothetical protein [Spirochaetales bacterium]